MRLRRRTIFISMILSIIIIIVLFVVYKMNKVEYTEWHETSAGGVIMFPGKDGLKDIEEGESARVIHAQAEKFCESNGWKFIKTSTNGEGNIDYLSFKVPYSTRCDDNDENFSCLQVVHTFKVRCVK